MTGAGGAGGPAGSGGGGEGGGGDDLPPGGGARPPRRRAYGWAARALGLGAALLLLGLLVGVLLPGTWSASTTRVVPLPPGSVFPWLDAPRSWEAWTPAGDVAFRYEGPARGEGATRSWDDPRYGEGTFVIVESRPPELVAYEVTVQGSLVTSGRVRVEPAPDGSRISWTEEGDFGWNPLMGWQALFMQRGQGALMDASLERLEGLLVAREAPPAPSLGGGGAERTEPSGEPPPER